MNYIILIVKGFFIGIAKIIPGVSGAMLAMSMGIYEKAMKSISDFSKNSLENFKFLFPLAIGAILAIILASKVIVFLLSNYYLPIMLLFIGLMIGGIPSIYKKIDRKKIQKKHFIILIISFLFVFLLTLIGKQDYFLQLNNVFSKNVAYFSIGIIDAITMIVPGISGTAIMMILGCYHLLLNMLSSLGNFSMITNNIISFLPFIIGVTIGIILVAKLMNYLFKKHSNSIYSSILGFASSSIAFLLLNTVVNKYSLLEIVISLILLVIGVIISLKLEKK